MGGDSGDGHAGEGSEDPAGRKRGGEGDPGGGDGRAKMRKVEKQAQERLSARVRQVIHREFGRALREKEEEAELLEQRLLQVRKALHVVRYAVVANHYSGGALIKQTRSQPEEVSIHPATRRLLTGKKPTSSYGEGGSQETTLASATAKTELDGDAEGNAAAVATQIVPGYVPPNPGRSVPEVTGGGRGVSHRVKRRLVVGNVSKWIACDQREDLATHKWMLYVRGDRDAPDVSDVVSKVRFLIHPSYAPHDLVEVDRPPFHLTRRGWGEFPARVQIHFKRARDKPVDVIHHIRLDRTYTGLQTLGAETLVDVWLHNPDSLREAREARAKVKSEALIDKFEVAPEGLVIPHEDVSDVISSGLLPMGAAGGWMDLGVSAATEPTVKEEQVEDPGPTPTKIVVFKNANGELQQQPISMAQANSFLSAKSKGKQQMGNGVASNGTSPSAGALTRKHSNGLSSRQIMPARMCNGKVRATGKILGVAASTVKREPVDAPQKEKVVVATANGISLVKERRIVRRPTGRGSPVPAGTTGGTSLLRSSAAKSGRSLLKQAAPVAPAPVVTAAISNSFGLPPHIVSTVTATPATALERAIPEVTLEQWRQVLGRSEQQEDSQDRVEEQLQQRSWKLLKRQIDYYKHLSEALKLKTEDFSTVETLIFRLARFLPLVTPLAKDPMYRAVHPYAAPNEDTFRQWPLGKQLSAEWTRAKTLSRMAIHISPKSGAFPSPRTIMHTLREHGFSHEISPRIPRNRENGAEPLAGCSLDEARLDDLMDSHRDVEESDGMVDVEGDENTSSTAIGRASGTRPNLAADSSVGAALTAPGTVSDLGQQAAAARFVREAASDVGIALEPHEISPGQRHPVLEQIMLKACQCLSELLIRKSFKVVGQRTTGESNPVQEVTASDVSRAIRENPELFSLFQPNPASLIKRS